MEWKVPRHSEGGQAGTNGGTDMKQKSTKKKKDDLENIRDYDVLVSKLKKLFDKAKAKGIDFNYRYECFECRQCGAYENFLCHESTRRTFLKSTLETNKEFIVLDRKENKRTIGDKIHYTFHFQVVCGVCGAHQRQTFKESFDAF